jgi:hypothetical protein
VVLAIGTPIKITSYTGIDTRTAVISGEYALEGTYAGIINETEPQAEEGMIINSYQKGKTITLSVENKTGGDSSIKVPFFTYQDYCAIDTEGHPLIIWSADQNVGMVVVPADYKGTIEIYFKEPRMWCAAEWMSLLFILGTVVYFFKNSRSGK